MISVNDIGRIAAECLERPDEFAGKTLEIAADALTAEEMEQVWKEVTGEVVGSDQAPKYPEAAQTIFDVGLY